MSHQRTETNFDLWLLPTGGDREPRPLFPPTEANQTGAVFSPQAQWVAYQSDEESEYEVYVAPFPGPGPKKRVSQGGGTAPVWARASGRLRLYFRQSDQILFVENKSDAESDFIPSVARPLFEVQSQERPFFTNMIGGGYDVDENGRVLMIERDPDEGTTKVYVIVHWAALLQRGDQSQY